MSEGIASSTKASTDGLRGNVVNLLAAQLATMCHAPWHAESEGVAEYTF